MRASIDLVDGSPHHVECAGVNMQRDVAWRALRVHRAALEHMHLPNSHASLHARVRRARRVFVDGRGVLWSSSEDWIGTWHTDVGE